MPESEDNGAVTWLLPPQMPWPQFLRLLRHPAPPPGWLEDAAALKDVLKKPMLLRWIAQHMQASPHLRNRLLPNLPWRSLAAIAADASAHPQARTHAVERLLARWPGMTMGERRSLAPLAPAALWPVIWKVRDGRVLGAFLQHPRLTVAWLERLILPELTLMQAEALRTSRWREMVPVAHQVLTALDRGLARPDSGLVLGLAASWILALPEEERVLAAARISHPALRRMVRQRGKEAGDLLD